MDKIQQLKDLVAIINKPYAKTEDVIPLIKALIKEMKNCKMDAEKAAKEVMDEAMMKCMEISREMKMKKGEKGDKGDSIMGPKGEDGKDGKDGQSIVGPAGKDGKDGSPDTGEHIVDKINALEIKPDLQIGKEHIKGLEEWEKSIESRISNSPRTIVGPRNGNSVQYYDISSELDGSTKSFNIPTNRRVLQVIGSSFPFNFRPLIDYTVDGRTLTFSSEIDEATSLASGQTITVLYVGMFNII